MNDFKKLQIKIEEDTDSLKDKTTFIMKNTPKIPLSVYNNLPPLFDLILNKEFHKDNDRKKDIMLLSSLTTISSMFPTIYINFHQKNYNPNLFFFLIGKAAQGKSLMKTGYEILKVQRDANTINNAKMLADYKSALSVWKTMDKKERGEEPEKPKPKNILMTGNISSSEMLNQLANGTNLLYDTEADAITNALKQDWGDYSTTLRKAFEHENESKLRVGADDLIIDKLSLSVCISGTLNQASKSLLSNTENGLFSRFMTYMYAEENNTESGRPTNSKYTSSEDYFAKEVSPIISLKIAEVNNNDIWIDMTSTQWDWVDKFKKDLLENIPHNTDKDASGVVRRLITITVRIVTIFTIFRKKMKLTPFEDRIYSEDIDVKNAIKIAKCLLVHSTRLLDSSVDEEFNLKDEKKGKATTIILKQLPKTFTNNQLHAILEKNDVSQRTGERAIKTLIEKNKIKRITRGVFEKIK